MKHTDDPLAFAPDWDIPIPYMERTRDWYLALGYGNPYRWAHYASSPFTPLSKPLADCKLLLVTTAAPYQPDKGDQGPGAPYNSAAKFYSVYTGPTSSDPDLRISHVGIDRKHTTATDSESWFPLAAARRAVDSGRIGALTEKFVGLPTNRSQRHTFQVDLPEVVRIAEEQQADIAVLVPNCPVCHQSCSLAARALESAGLATVVLGAAKDIVEHCGVPRFVFSDFPLGNSAGIPHDPSSVDATLELGFATLESAPAPRTTVTNPLTWPGDRSWRQDYNNIDQVSTEELARMRRENDEIKRVAQQVRDEAVNR